ncbi:hypothetical protein [Streptomyces sp. NPDC013187]
MNAPFNGAYEHYCSLKKAGSDAAVLRSDDFELPASDTYTWASHIIGL